jgi:MFS family permease
MPAAAPEITLRTIAPSAYGPAVLYGIGSGASTPVIALAAIRLGATVPTAAFVVALVGIGQLVGDLPAGALATKLGDRWAMVVSSFAICGGMAICVLARHVGMLGVGVAIAGFAGAVFGLARQSYLTEVVPLRLRARALSTLGGSQRIGGFVGPFLGAWVTRLGGVDAGFAVYAVCALAAGVLVLVVRDLRLPEGATGSKGLPQQVERPSLLAMASGNRRVLATLGSCAMLLMVLRQARQSVLPLWCDHIGVGVSTTSIVVGISGAVDMLMFYPSGFAMDRFGRAFVGVPSMLVLALGHALIVFASGLGTVILVAIVMGIGNGMGAGLVMTLGADTSPATGRQTYLSLWRLITDLGAAGGPAAIGVVTAVAGLGPASVAIAGVGVVAAVMLKRWAPRHLRPT